MVVLKWHYVDFYNMIYIAGPSDIPAFSVVKGRGGAISKRK